VNSILSVSLVTITMGLLVAISLTLVVFNGHSAYAQGTLQNLSNTSNNNSTLFVVGNAQTMVKPDKVTLSLSVETTNTTANAALNANSKAMNNTLDALKAAGVRENETSTAFFSISPNYRPIDQQEGQDQYFPPPTLETKDIISYTVANSITVDSYNLLNVSQWIDTAVQAGVNDVSSIYFSLSNERSEAIKNNLLKQAVADAKSKADIAAAAVGLNVIGVKSINIESVGGFPPTPPQPFLTQETAGKAAAPGGGSPTPIIAGEQEVTSSVDTIFLIG
jgi:uncharacterized protein YggE